MQVYLCTGHRGQYENYHSWLVGVFSSREAAVSAAEEQRQARLDRYTFDTDEFWGPTRYVVEEVELDHFDK